MSRAERLGWIVGLVALALAALGWLLEPRSFAYAWVAGFSTWSMWPLGGMALILAHALTGGRWGYAARPGLLLGVTTLPLLVPAVIPILIMLPTLYHWAQPDHIGHVKNGFYLNPTFFAERGVVYVVIWFGLGWLILRELRRGGDLVRLAPPGLILLAITFTFAAIDVVMSLEDFPSSIFGMLSACSAGLLALAVATLLAAPAIEQPVLADLAKLLLGLVALWTYLDFMQLLIVWESDLATDAPWYVRRTTPGWGTLAVLIEIFRFVVPFFVLVLPQLQRNARAVTGVCILLIATTVLRSWWLVLPAGGRSIGWIDVAVMLAFGGLATGLACRAARSGLEPRYV